MSIKLLGLQHTLQDANTKTSNF